MKKLLLSVGLIALTFSAFTQTSVDPPAGTSIEQNILVIYPNPAREVFKIRYNGTEEITDVTIRDVDGRKVKTYDKPKPEKFFITDLTPGVYVVDITVGSKVVSHKLIVEQ